MTYSIKKYLPSWLKRRFKRTFRSIHDSIFYRSNRTSTPTGRFNHVIFVCKGNICRSAFAEYYLRSRITDDSVIVESCGTEVNQGFYSPPEACAVGKEFGIDLINHVSKGMKDVNLDKADIIIPMEFHQYTELALKFPEHRPKLKLLQNFAPWPGQLLCNIYDPYGLGEEEFRHCYKKMKKALDPLAQLLGPQR